MLKYHQQWKVRTKDIEGKMRRLEKQHRMLGLAMKMWRKYKHNLVSSAVFLVTFGYLLCVIHLGQSDNTVDTGNKDQTSGI